MIPTIRQRLGATLEELWIFLFAWIPTPLGILLRLVAWRVFFGKCANVRFAPGLTISGMRNISLGKKARIGKNSFLTAGDGILRLGDNVAISPCVHLSADHGEIRIGDYVAIGPACVLRAANHEFSDVAMPIMRQGHKFGRIIIDNDVWIGANCVITPDVHIGRGAIVGAGAVVTRDVQAWSIVGGVPARLIGWRDKSLKGDPNGAEMPGV